VSLAKKEDIMSQSHKIEKGQEQITEKERRGRILAAVALAEFIGAILLMIFVDPMTLSLWERIGLTILCIGFWFFSLLLLWRWYKKAPESCGT
jgi:uncharacterized iron-regulated membrane protein